LLIVAYISAIVYCSIYGPQPLLLVLRAEFNMSEATTSLMVTSVLVPLSFAPLVYGYLLESIPIKKLLVWSVSLLSATALAIFFAGEFWLILGLRFCQGLIIPAILTALMTYISTMYHGRAMQKGFAIYIASNILGGFLGRVVSGAVSTLFGWRYSFLALFVALIVGLFFLYRLSPAPKTDFERVSPRNIMNTLKRPGFLRIYTLIACAFFVFVSIPNFLPFRLTDITGGISEFRIGMAYSGYLMGIIIALSTPRLVGYLRSEARALRAGLCCFLAATLIFLSDNTAVIFADMFLFCGGMAVLQSTCSGYINKLATSRKGVANGLYISIYYAGGSLGSYLPGWVYTQLGWNYYIYCLSFVVCLALFLARGIAEDTTAHPIKITGTSV
jgi:MFS transporter, YNFM family, putative membrane transport protein